MTKMKSSEVKKLPAARSLLYALGFSGDDLEKPIIGIVNPYNDVVPGHMHLNSLANEIKKGVRKAGGIPLQFPTIGVCDGIAMGHEGMKYSLPSRELIADEIEIMVRSHGIFDGIVFIGACDKNGPGQLMAAARLDLPSIFVTAGPMLPGKYCDRVLDVGDSFAARAQLDAGQITEEEYENIVSNSCPGAGSCSGLFTANSMACATEALGLTLPGCATIHAVDKKKLEISRESGEQIMKLVEAGLTARKIMTEDAFMNAFAVDMAIGGSTNTVLHIPAIAKEAGFNFDLDKINQISARTPNICKISPSSQYRMIDRRAGFRRL